MSTDDEIETMLRTLPVRRASSALDGRIGAATARRPGHPVRWAVAASLIFGSVGIVFKVATFRSPQPVAVATPELTTRLVCDTTATINDGVVVADNKPYNVVRQTTMHEVVLIDPRTNARLEVRTPVERVVIVPADVF